MKKGKLVFPEKGDRVIDDAGNVGIVCDSTDPHNIYVEYENENGGGGYYCIVPSCAEYDPLRGLDSVA